MKYIKLGISRYKLKRIRKYTNTDEVSINISYLYAKNDLRKEKITFSSEKEKERILSILDNYFNVDGVTTPKTRHKI